MSRRSTESGFSIVEAMVALAVFAMAGVGLVQLQAQSVRTLTDVETRALASVVAQNELIEVMALRTPPEHGAREGESGFGGRAWTWRMEIAPAPDPGSSRVSVEVSDAARPGVIARAHAFIATPSAEPVQTQVEP